VAEHHDLELLELARAHPQRRNRQHTSKQQVQQRYDQAAPPSTRIRRRRLYGREPAPPHGPRRGRGMPIANSSKSLPGAHSRSHAASPGRARRWRSSSMTADGPGHSPRFLAKSVPLSNGSCCRSSQRIAALRWTLSPAKSLFAGDFGLPRASWPAGVGSVARNPAGLASSPLRFVHVPRFCLDNRSRSQPARSTNRPAQDGRPVSSFGSSATSSPVQDARSRPRRIKRGLLAVRVFGGTVATRVRASTGLACAFRCTFVTQSREV